MYQIVTYFYEDQEKIAQVYNESKNLWGEHVCYTRNAIISLLNGTADISAVSDRLMKNQDEIAELLYPHYDRNDVEAYSTVLKEHITLAVSLINAVKAGGDTAEATKAWYDNGDKMLTWMENENPYYWSRVVTKPLWNDHLKLTLDQVNSRLREDWVSDIDAFDYNHHCMQKWADLYATGIVYNNMEYFATEGPNALKAKPLNPKLPKVKTAEPKALTHPPEHKTTDYAAEHKPPSYPVARK
jgi:hypothetical protein